jgi:hypothetical protein
MRATTLGQAVGATGAPGGVLLPLLGTTIPGNGSTGIVRVDSRGGNFQATVGIFFGSGVTGNATLQYTVDDILDEDWQITGKGAPAPYASPGTVITESNVVWFSHPNLTAVTVNTISNIAFPVTAIRITVGAYAFSAGTPGIWGRLIMTPFA